MRIMSVGTVRKIDDLGRIVIPKEVRKALGYKEGDSFEIYTTEDNGIKGVYLRKYEVSKILEE